LSALLSEGAAISSRYAAVSTSRRARSSGLVR
jgi:hypothetical protein